MLNDDSVKRHNLLSLTPNQKMLDYSALLMDPLLVTTAIWVHAARLVWAIFSGKYVQVQTPNFRNCLSKR